VSALKVGLVQQRCAADRAANWRRSAAGIRAARARGARLVALPELHGGRYFCQRETPAAFDAAERIPGPSTEFFGALARELGVVLVLSLFEKRAVGLCHNTAVVIERNGAIAGIYRKMHIPDDPGYYEKFYFAPGDLGFNPIPTSAGNLGVLVCWDQWYPEAARLMALRGAELLIYPTAIGWDPRAPRAEQARQRAAWLTVQRGHAVANALPVICVNRTGFEPAPGGRRNAGIRFWGTSFVAGPQGELLARAATDEERVLVCALRLERTEQVRRRWPFFRDRRIDAYADLLTRFADGAAAQPLTPAIRRSRRKRRRARQDRKAQSAGRR
jgi:N-carbamoylputrescine amidase